MEPVNVVDSDGRIVRVVPPPSGVVPRWLSHWDVRIDRDVENRRGGRGDGQVPYYHICDMVIRLAIHETAIHETTRRPAARSPPLW